jgi:1,4-dihydroxy-2-naphthoyl-CoA synthase
MPTYRKPQTKSQKELSNGLVKAAFARGPMTFEDLLALESDGQGVLYGTEDFQEGRKAFMEKRKPVFRGR